MNRRMRISTTDSSKSANVNRLFGSIASRYDLANHVLSLGIDRLWRKKAVSDTRPAVGDRLLDMCCGTGDFAIAFTKFENGPKKITCCDFSGEMIAGAERKFAKLKPNLEVSFSKQDCTATDFADGSFDVISCGFGVRNMADLDKGLGEMYRLLAGGGKVCILEFTLPKNIIIRFGYLAYFRFVLPLIGAALTGDMGAYRYLVSSVRNWDKNVDLPKRLEDAGFEMVTVKPVSMGIACIYVARKL